MKAITKKRNFAMALLLAVTLLFPMGVMAQSDGFFSNYSDGEGGNREGDPTITGGISNGGFDEAAPLGEGLAILAVSAAGYAVLKRRKNHDDNQKNY